MVDCVYSFLHNGGARFIPSPEGEGSSLPLHPDVIKKVFMNIESIESYMMPSISFKNFICPNPDSNRGHSDLQSDALPTELLGRIGGPDAIRTHDLRHVKATS